MAVREQRHHSPFPLPRRHRPPVDHGDSPRFVQVPARQPRHQRRGVAQVAGGQTLGRHRVLESERTHPGSQQRREVRAAPQLFPDVPGEAAEIRPAAHGGAESDVGWREARQLERRYLDRARRERDRLAPARPPVGALALHLHRRIGGRPLLGGAPKPRERSLDAPTIERLPGVRGASGLAGAVVGRGRAAQPDDALVRLGPIGHVRREPGRAPHDDHEQPRRKRVERAQVSDPPKPERATHLVDHVVRRGSIPLRDQRHAGDQPGGSLSCFNTASMRCACSRPRSSSKRSSGLVRRRSSCASWARRNRATLANPSSVWAFSASVPMTLTRIRAWVRSRDTSTAVTVTKPTRGSRTLAVRNSATVCRISSATRSGRRRGREDGTDRRVISQKARARVHDAGAVRPVHQAVRLLEHALGVAPLVRHHTDRQLGALPQVVVCRLRGRDVEAVVQPVLEALQNVALLLQRAAPLEVQLPSHQPHHHASPAPGRAHAGVSERATSSTLYASIRSPTLMSLNPSMPMPHSKPSRTSRTSSLNRLSDAMLPSYTSTPSRITRTRAVRGMTPERTKHPAMVPILAILNVCRTSASPSTTSFFSGVSRPSIAAFTSSTASRSAEARAFESGRTWKPTMMAPEAFASRTSESVMAPTPRCTTSTLTS